MIVIICAKKQAESQKLSKTEKQVIADVTLEIESLRDLFASNIKLQTIYSKGAKRGEKLRPNIHGTRLKRTRSFPVIVNDSKSEVRQYIERY